MINILVLLSNSIIDVISCHLTKKSSKTLIINMLIGASVRILYFVALIKGIYIVSL